ncbi:hypothetical protein OsJ_17790 [Oryza sativa Japonica Group]|uniref:Uncharacterized protein n=1 Tax=Oryza sativa subsp. japonica TaxID=39947 RepID=B9FNG9_ORYSJ|nr:hypothetical protein OsJ_17790 [Oryza sativa Japonica Group]
MARMKAHNGTGGWRLSFGATRRRKSYGGNGVTMARMKAHNGTGGWRLSFGATRRRKSYGGNG